MTKREAIKQAAELGFKLSYSNEWEEYRLAPKGLSAKREEAVAYYTWDVEDALGTAKHIAETR